MCNDTSYRKKGIFTAKVRSNDQIGLRFYRLSIEFNGEGAAAFGSATPGQFLELKAENLSIPKNDQIPEDLRDAAQRQVILRRPFSFVDIYPLDSGNVCVDILYCVLGASTVRMTTLKKDDTLSITGPLGNGFRIPAGLKYAILVAGGMGAPPLQHFASYLSKEYPDVKVVAFVGARSAKDMPFFSLQKAMPVDSETFILNEFSSCGACSHIATDDGSVGFKGFVTQNLEHWLDNNEIQIENTTLFGCGPEVMLKSLAGVADKRGIDCQVSLERRMACGIGLCQSCAIEVQNPNGSETLYKLCCKDGPVFDSKEIVW